MGSITHKRKTKAALPAKSKIKLPLKKCPECGGKLTLNFELGKYIVMHCAACDKLFRHFPPEPMTSWTGAEERAGAKG